MMKLYYYLLNGFVYALVVFGGTKLILVWDSLIDRWEEKSPHPVLQWVVRQSFIWIVGLHMVFWPLIHTWLHARLN